MLYLSFVGRILRVDFSWLWNWRTWLYRVVRSKASFGSAVLEQADIGSRCECELQFRHVSTWQKNDLPVGWLFAAGRERLGYRLPSSLERPKWKFPSPGPPALNEEM